MKDGIKAIVGKTIAHVVVKTSKRSPTTQLFLVFTDNTSFEIYGSAGEFTWSKGLRQENIEEVRQYMSGADRTMVEFPSPEQATE